MKNKKRLTILGVALILCVSILTLTSCFGLGSPTTEIAVTSIVLDSEEIRVSTDGEGNTATIGYTVLPENATDKSVRFSIVGSGAGQYVSVSSEGVVKGKKETSELEGGKVEIRVTSASNPSVRASAYVTVENVSPTGIRFEQTKYSKNLADAPFTLTPIFEPAHASVNTEYTLRSDNEDVAQVDENGLVTVKSRGSATIIAELTYVSGVKAQTTVEVKYLEPQYVLEWNKDDEENFEQTPGDPKTIRFSVRPAGQQSIYADPSPSITWKIGSTVLDTADTSGLSYNYTPSSTVTAGDYTVTVDIKDADDQTRTLTSPAVKIYQPLTTDNINIADLTDPSAKSHLVTAGDRVSLKLTISGDKRYGDSYRWYTYTFNPATEEDYSGIGTEEDIYRYILENKTKPSSDKDHGDYSYIGTSDGGRSVTYTAVIEDGGKVYVFAVPIIAEEARYALMKGSSAPYEAEAAEPAKVVDIESVYGLKPDGTIGRKLVWERLSGGEEYEVELIWSTGETEYYSSSSTQYKDYFDGSSFVIPSTKTGEFSARVRTPEHRWSESFSSSGKVPSGIEGYLEPLGSTSIDLYLYDVKELGELLNYLRVFQPDTTSFDSDKITRSDSDNAAYSYEYTVEALVAFRTSTLNTSGNLVSKKVSYYDGRATDSVSYKDVYVNASSSDPGSQTEFSETLSVAFGSYCEAGSAGFSVISYSADAAWGKVEFRFAVSVKTAVTHYTTDDSKLIAKPTETLVTVPKSGNTVTYFGGCPTDKEIEVSDSTELYYAAVLGLKPVAKAGSSAETILNRAAVALDGIVGDEMTDYEKAIAIYDYLAMNIYYDHNVAESSAVPSSDASFHLDGAFGVGTFDGRAMAVCDGMSKAYALMCYMVGIPSSKVVGVAGQGAQKGGHAWNTILIDGKRYNVDLTWGSTGTLTAEGGTSVSMISHYYLFASDEMMYTDTHVRYGEYGDSVTDKYYYYTLNGLVGKKTSCTDIRGEVKERIVTGKTVTMDILVHRTALPSGGVSNYVEKLLTEDKTLGVKSYSFTQSDNGDDTMIITLYITA